MIWFTLALAVVSFFAMQLLAPKPKVENARRATLGDLRFPRAESGAPIPYIFGKVRLRAPNVIWYGDLTSVANVKKIKSGIFKSEKQVTSYSYGLGFQLALCTGPGVLLHRIWIDKQIAYLNGPGLTGDTTFNVSRPNLFGGLERGGGFQGNITFYSGEFTQTQNSYLQGVLGVTDIPAHVGVSHLVFHNVQIGTQAFLREMSFELARYPDNLGLGASRIIGDDDLNPMEILYSAFTEEWNGAGRDPAEIDTASFLAAAATLEAEGHGMSLQIESANPARDAAREVLRQVDGILDQDPVTGKIAVKLIREDYTVASLPVFDESNVAKVTGWRKTSVKETINQVRILFTERDREYKQNSAVMAQDMANIATQQEIRNSTVSFPGCTLGPLATQLAFRELSQLSVPLFPATLHLKREAYGLRSGSPFVLNWPDFGVSGLVMRAQKINEGELGQGTIVIEALQDKFAAANALWADPEATGWNPLDRTAQDIVDFALFESPYYFLQQQEEFNPTDFPDSGWLWCLPRNPTGTMELFDMIVSDDSFATDVTTELNQKEYADSTTLVDPLVRELGAPDGSVAVVKVEGAIPEVAVLTTGIYPRGFLEDVTLSDIINSGKNIVIIGNEIMAFETFTDNGDGTYDLENVYRALLDTKFEDHAVGDAVLWINDLDWFSLNARPDTDVLEVKLLSYTDRDAQDLTDVSAIPITLNQRYDRPAPPDYTTVETVRWPMDMIGVTSIDVAWRERNKTDTTIALVDDATDTPEGGTTYDAELYIDGVLIESQTSIATTSTTFSTGVDGWGQARVDVYAVVGGLRSYNADEVHFFYANYLSIGSELLTNAGFESGLTGWSTVSGSWSAITSVPPIPTWHNVDRPSETDHAESTGSTNELSQDFTIGGESGRQGIFRIWQNSLDVLETGQLILELRDGGGVLDTVTTPLISVPTLGKWHMHEIQLPLRTDATIVRARLSAPGVSYWDGASLRTNTVSTNTSFRYDNLASVSSVDGAWGLRLLVSGYSGALIRVRDTYDNSEQDVGADPDGNLEPFHTVQEPRIVKIYDQSGNGSHLESFAAEDPRLRYMESETGRSASNANIAESGYRDENSPGTSLPYMVARPNTFLVCGEKPSGGVSTSYMFNLPESEPQVSPHWRWALLATQTVWRLALNGSLDAGDAWAQAPTNGKNVIFIDAQNGDVYHNDDVTAVDTFTAADVTYPNNARLHIGARDDGLSNWWDIVGFYEFVICSGTISSGDRQTAIEALGTYWFNESY